MKRPGRGAAGRTRPPAIYVDHAGSLGAIAVIRSLGRAGYRVHAASDDPLCLGACSRYASHAPVHPPIDTPEFEGWFRRYLDDHDIAAIVPSERLILRLNAQLEEFHHLMPFGGSTAQLRRALGKYELFERSLESGLVQHLPPLRLIDFERGAERAYGEMRFPAFIKTDAMHARQPGQSSQVLPVPNPQELESTLLSVSRRFSRAVVQGYVPGTGIGASFLVWNRKPVLEFTHRRLHEVPHTGGVSSWREEFVHPGIRNDALARVHALGWERGPVMVEYRLDASTGEFWLMEANARFWGSLHLPYYAGVDFPATLLRHFLEAKGLPLPDEPTPVLPRRRLSCRHLPAEFQHCWGKLKAPDVPPRAKLTAAVSLGLLALDPRVKSDLGSFPGDRLLLLIALRRFLTGAGYALLRRYCRHTSVTLPVR